MILSAAMLLEWLGRRAEDPALGAASALVDSAVRAVVAAGVSTPDLGGTAGTRSVTEAVLGALSR